MDVLQLITDFLTWLMLPATLNVSGFIVVIAYAMHNASKHNLNPMIMYWSGVFAMAGALIGGRLLVALTNPENLDSTATTLSLLFDGSRSVMGAFIGAIIVGGVYLNFKKVSVMQYMDIAAPAVALGYVFARLGCFVNGDDFGVLSDLPWATQFYPGTEIYSVHLERSWINQGAVSSLAVHPTQLYHALVGVAGFFLLRYWNSNRQGSCVAIAFLYYGVTRFIIQFFRDDHWGGSAMIDTAQWFSLLFIIFGLVLWFYHKVSLNREELVIAG